MNARKKEVLKIIHKFIMALFVVIILAGIVASVVFSFKLKNDNPMNSSYQEPNISFCQEKGIEFMADNIEIYQIYDGRVFFRYNGNVKFYGDVQLHKGNYDELIKLQIDGEELDPYSNLQYEKYSSHTMYLEGDAKVSCRVVDGKVNIYFTIVREQLGCVMSSELKDKYNIKVSNSLDNMIEFNISSINNIGAWKDYAFFTNTNRLIEIINKVCQVYVISLIVIVWTVAIAVIVVSVKKNKQ